MLAALIVLALLGVWEAYASLGPVDELLLPAPSAVATSLVDDRALLWDNLLVTGSEILLGLLVALLAGALLAVALHLVAPLRRALYPLLIASQTLPIVLIAPLLVAWFGFGLTPKIFIVALVCFFPVVVATLDGLASADPEQRKLLRSLGASRGQVLRFVEAPGALPRVFTGARVSVAVAAIAAVLAEQAGSEDGLGLVITRSIPQFETARAYAAVVVLSAFVLLLFAALSALERRLAPWAATHSPTPGGTR